MSERRFPIQRVGSIPWSLAERAFAVYAKRYGSRQSIERMAERGGFGLAELGWLLGSGREPDWANAQEMQRECERGVAEIVKATDAEREQARADRDREWLAALAKEHAHAGGYSAISSSTVIDNVTELMGLGEEFAALLRGAAPIPLSALAERGEDE